jgi:hypothetical protein
MASTTRARGCGIYSHIVTQSAELRPNNPGGLFYSLAKGLPS